MLGHKLCQTIGSRRDVWATIRDGAGPARVPGLDPVRLIRGVRAEQFDTVVRAVAAARPDVVVNCIGVVKQRGEAKDPLVSLTVNSLFPHRLAALCGAAGARLIHLSTDCVFSGRSGAYSETDAPDATDLYGRSKQLGEVGAPGCLTMRTSMIGRELTTSQGLIEWLLAQRGRAPGYTHAIFSGLTTLELSRVILNVIDSHPGLSGVYHVASAAINKYDLLVLLNLALNLGLTIEPDSSVRIDRSLDGRRFAGETGYVAPTWPDMIAGLAADDTPYETWRQHAG